MLVLLTILSEPLAQDLAQTDAQYTLLNKCVITPISMISFSSSNSPILQMNNYDSGPVSHFFKVA